MLEDFYAAEAEKIAVKAAEEAASRLAGRGKHNRRKSLVPDSGPQSPSVSCETQSISVTSSLAVDT